MPIRRKPALKDQSFGVTGNVLIALSFEYIGVSGIYFVRVDVFLDGVELLRHERQSQHLCDELAVCARLGLLSLHYC